jgi:hypothetical protein
MTTYLSDKQPQTITRYIFKNYRSRNINNLNKIIAEIQDKRPDFPGNILELLEQAGTIRRMSGNLSQLHYETV